MEEEWVGLFWMKKEEEEGMKNVFDRIINNNNIIIIKIIVDSKRERRNHTLSHTRRDIIYLHTFYTMGVRIQR